MFFFGLTSGEQRKKFHVYKVIYQIDSTLNAFVKIDYKKKNSAKPKHRLTS